MSDSSRNLSSLGQSFRLPINPRSRSEGAVANRRGSSLSLRTPPPVDWVVAQGAKRRWEDMSQDDLGITADGDISTDVSSRASYTTRRKKHYVRNRKASERRAAALRNAPEFTHIKSHLCDDFYRHYKPGFSFAEPDEHVAEYTRLHGPPDASCDPEKLCFLTACDDVQMGHLKRFDRPERNLNPKYRDAYRLALSAVAQLLELPEKLRFPSADDLANVPYKKSKFPGAYYRAKGYATREEAQELALPDARDAWVQLMLGSVVSPHTVRLGGRGKPVHKSAAEVRAANEPKGRLILMLSQRDLLLNGVTEKLLTQAYLPDEYPLSVGMGWFKGNVARFAERYVGFDKYFCFDAEKFDASIDAYMVRDVIAIFRRQFERGEESDYDAYWNFVLESLITAPIQRDDGWIMEKFCGTTSGHSHNTLVQCVCTLLIGYTAMFHCCPELTPNELVHDIALESLGDDNLLAIMQRVAHLTVDDIADVVLDAFGINWGGDKSFATYSFADGPVEGEEFTEEGRFQGIQYLGKYFRAEIIRVEGEDRVNAVPYRPVIETFTHLYYPERKGRSKHHTYQRVLGNLLDAYGNPLAAKWLNGLLDWLEPQMDIVPTAWDPDEVFDVAKEYTAEKVEVPKFQRWIYEEWLALTLVKRDLVSDMYEVV